MHYETPVPFGQDRLIPIWVATLALWQKSRTVHFDSAAQILDFFDLPKDGPHYRRMVVGFQRVFAATIFFGAREHVKDAEFVDLARFQFFDRMKLWFNTGDQPKPKSGGDFDNAIILSEAFYAEISAHPIPVEHNVVAALANAPGILDFYMWLVWRSWTIKAGCVSIPLVAERGLNEQLGSTERAALPPSEGEDLAEASQGLMAAVPRVYLRGRAIHSCPVFPNKPGHTHRGPKTVNR